MVSSSPLELLKLPLKWEAIGSVFTIVFQCNHLEAFMHEIPFNAVILSRLIIWRDQLLQLFPTFEHNHHLSFNGTAFTPVHCQGLKHLEAILGMVNNKPLQQMSNTQGQWNTPSTSSASGSKFWPIITTYFLGKNIYYIISHLMQQAQSVEDFGGPLSLRLTPSTQKP
ncbi:hypothetical protein BS47DRAFT_1367117 [Hydnum rufescens UP504]|uniref:Uncharacterized protein n=1 Tax=Hydnum rufescens UP504 TaxID=1448309 RepID=A0A9P6AK00_9AGAM|nr:hypothetical protein BS47DRAFT_1367117 [Hydnum rufescens UP504]